jgi:hypothetical protein
MATETPIQDQEEQEQEHSGGGRFNRLLGIIFIGVAMIGGVAIALGVQSSGTGSECGRAKGPRRPRRGGAKSRRS